MTVGIPSRDGEITQYNLSQSSISNPRIYFVNGIRVEGRDHARTGALISLLTERPVWGVYNRTGGAFSDLAQCALDYMQNAGARATNGGLQANKNISDADLQGVIDGVIKKSVVWNRATAELFKTLAMNRNSMQMIVAHSQGNLITSNALFVMEKVLGSGSLQKVRVYSLASPSPAWPLGLRRTNGGGGRQENAFMNDLVALLRPHNLAAKIGVTRFQNAGDFRTHAESGAVSIAPHDTRLNIALNFLKSIRNDLGLSSELSPDFLEKCSKIADAQIPD